MSPMILNCNLYGKEYSRIANIWIIPNHFTTRWTVPPSFRLSVCVLAETFVPINEIKVYLVHIWCRCNRAGTCPSGGRRVGTICVWISFAARRTPAKKVKTIISNRSISDITRRNVDFLLVTFDSGQEYYTGNTKLTYFHFCFNLNYYYRYYKRQNTLCVC